MEEDSNVETEENFDFLNGKNSKSNLRENSNELNLENINNEEPRKWNVMSGSGRTIDVSLKKKKRIPFKEIHHGKDRQSNLGGNSNELNLEEVENEVQNDNKDNEVENENEVQNEKELENLNEVENKNLAENENEAEKKVENGDKVENKNKVQSEEPQQNENVMHGSRKIDKNFGLQHFSRKHIILRHSLKGKKKKKSQPFKETRHGRNRQLNHQENRTLSNLKDIKFYDEMKEEGELFANLTKSLEGKKSKNATNFTDVHTRDVLSQVPNIFSTIRSTLH